MMVNLGYVPLNNLIRSAVIGTENLVRSSAGMAEDAGSTGPTHRRACAAVQSHIPL